MFKNIVNKVKAYVYSLYKKLVSTIHSLVEKASFGLIKMG